MADLGLPMQDINLANTLVDEFVCRPHWTKNTRDTLKRSVQNLDPDVSVPANATSTRIADQVIQYLARFNKVRKDFDPDGLYRSVVGEILGFYD